MSSIRWTDEKTKGSCYPEFNLLGDHVKLSKVFGIQEAYKRASVEVSTLHNQLLDRINELEIQLDSLTKVEKSTNVQYETRVPISGRKPKALTDEQVTKAERMRNAGLSFKEIAKEFDVSDRTVRRALHSGAQDK